MTSSDQVDYANYSGIYKSELVGAIIFAVIYLPLFLYNVLRSIRHPTYVLIVLSFFCLLRIVAFTLRAILAGSQSAGQNLSLVIAEQIIYSTGFFGLLYSAYTLVLDRELIMTGPNGRNAGPGIYGVVSRLMRNRHLIRLVLVVAVAVGITSGVQSSSNNQNTLNTSQTLHRVSIYIFLVVACLLVLVTARLAFEENAQGTHDTNEAVGKQYRIIILLGIAFLCVIREAFFAATAKNTKQADNSHLWYPLSALTELVAVLLFAVPGLVPSRAEVIGDLQRKLDHNEEIGSGKWNSPRVTEVGVPMLERTETYGA